MKKQSVKFFILVSVVVPLSLVCGRVDGKPKAEGLKSRRSGESGRVNVRINVDNLKLPHAKEVGRVDVKLNARTPIPSRLPQLNLTRGPGRSKFILTLPACLKNLSINNPNGSVTIKKGGDKNVLTTVFEWKEMPVPKNLLSVKPSIKGSSVAITMPEHAGLNSHLTLVLGSSPDVAIHQKNGNISVNRLNAHCKAKSVNGNIQLMEVLGDIKVQAVNGSIQLKNNRPFDKACKLETQNGSIKIAIPQASNTRLDLAAHKGRTMSRLKMHDVKTKSVKFDEGNKLFGVVGNGKGSIHASVVNGWVEVL